ncbi:MAG TPA: hypothetical protein VL048_04245 [Xanthobacteraceae bacterium]|nr:hypothetical protein [Xanthobacteraceae bacterium]
MAVPTGLVLGAGTIVFHALVFAEALLPIALGSTETLVRFAFAFGVLTEAFFGLAFVLGILTEAPLAALRRLVLAGFFLACLSAAALSAVGALPRHRGLIALKTLHVLRLGTAHFGAALGMLFHAGVRLGGLSVRAALSAQAGAGAAGRALRALLRCGDTAARQQRKRRDACQKRIVSRSHQAFSSRGSVVIASAPGATATPASRCLFIERGPGAKVSSKFLPVIVCLSEMRVSEFPFRSQARKRGNDYIQHRLHIQRVSR